MFLCSERAPRAVYVSSRYFSKFFLKKLGVDGLPKLLHAFDDKSAQAMCIFALRLSPDDDVMLFKGVTEGRIVSARGDNKFGWDPIFQPDGFDQTFAEMD